MDEQSLIEQIEEMRVKGFPASRQDLLPRLYQEVFKRGYKQNCPTCAETAFEHLKQWAIKKNKPTEQRYMGAYKFTKGNYDKKPVIDFQGRKIQITADNLTDARAQLLLSIPKYAHLIELIETVKEIEASIKDETGGNEADNALNQESPNEVAVDLTSTASTSTGQKEDGVKPKGKPGPKPKQK